MQRILGYLGLLIFSRAKIFLAKHYKGIREGGIYSLILMLYASKKYTFAPETSFLWKVKEVVTNQGRIRTDAVVNCTGAWANYISGMVGVHTPLGKKRIRKK